MKIRIGEIFRVARNTEDPKYRNYLELTKGKRDLGADIYKGIWAYSKIKEPLQDFARVPAILLHSNPFKEGTQDTPWLDIVEPDSGYALYHGDNRNSSVPPLESRGNALLVSISNLYSDPMLRKFAPPILLFTQKEVGGNRKGYREFSGYGLPTAQYLCAQKEKGNNRYFTNLVAELALFRLDRENELFDWDWIDQRRDSARPAEEVLRSAPEAWKRWVLHGSVEIERCRRKIKRRQTVSSRSQIKYSNSDNELLKEILSYFEKTRHSFEGLASLIAARIIGRGCKRGWVTKRSGDGGIDFVCRLDVGDAGNSLSCTPMIVLGQAKCQKLSSPIGGKDLARLVARLQRGWLGIFVTTGVFSEQAQLELQGDQYPIILVNGQRLSREIRTILIEQGISLKQLLDQQSAWHEQNILPLEPSRILDDFSLEAKTEALNAMTMTPRIASKAEISPA